MGDICNMVTDKRFVYAVDEIYVCQRVAAAIHISYARHII